ncbi:MAG: sulfurtransferase [Gammaproteobacteria bacterium]|nr:sulfurtransferase [Gammaproteobacteria bacterium]
MYANPRFLVETDWLAKNLDDPRLRIFDVTGMLTSSLVNLADERSYRRGHIPGAAFLDVAGRDGALAKPGASLPWTWPETDVALGELGRIGVSRESRVVLYAASPRPGVDKGMMWCTRAWWVMASLGVDCAVLNGGFEKWQAEGRPVSTENHRYPSTSCMAGPSSYGAVASRQDVLRALQTSGVCVVDALSEDSFAGRGRAIYGPRKGHISGALNVPANDLLAADGTFLDAPSLRARLGERRLFEAEQVVTYCGGGIAATVDAFALALLGHPNVMVYDASLMEWAPDPDLPMSDPQAR